MGNKLDNYLKVLHGKHFFNKFKEIQDFNEIPKKLRGKIFTNTKSGKIFFDKYKSQGQFYLINVDGEDYLTHKDSGNDHISIDGISSAIDKNKMESILGLSAFNLSLSEFLDYLSNKNQKETTNEMSESYLRKKLVKIITEQYLNNIGTKTPMPPEAEKALGKIAKQAVTEKPKEFTEGGKKNNSSIIHSILSSTKPEPFIKRIKCAFKSHMDGSLIAKIEFEIDGNKLGDKQPNKERLHHHATQIANRIKRETKMPIKHIQVSTKKV